MKNLLKAFWLLPPASVIFVAGCSSTPQAIFKSNTGVTMPHYGQVTTIDTTGWMGDGELIYIFYLDDEDGRTLESRVKDDEHWSSLPMTATLDRLVYGHFDSPIPRVENGYYYFYDEQHKTYSDGEVENASSYDFIIGMYDAEASVAYYYEQHT